MECSGLAVIGPFGSFLFECVLTLAFRHLGLGWLQVWVLIPAFVFVGRMFVPLFSVSSPVFWPEWSRVLLITGSLQVQ